MYQFDPNEFKNDLDENLPKLVYDHRQLSIVFNITETLFFFQLLVERERHFSTFTFG